MINYEGGFIPSYRSWLEWEWYDDANTFRVFFHILHRAVWKETKYHGLELRPGQWVTSVKKIADEVHLTPRQVSTALKHLEMSNDVSIKKSPKNSIITVNSWSALERNVKQNVKQMSNECKTDVKQMSNECKTPFHYKQKQGNKETRKQGRESGEAAAPSLDEIKDYFLDRNFKSDPQAFYFYYGSNNWTRHGQPILNWCSLAELWERREQERPTTNIEDTNSSFEIDDLRQLGILTEEII